MKPVIAVVGATGRQGGGVVDALLAQGTFAVRALSRRPDSSAAQALIRRGCDLRRADLTEPATLETAFDGCHGAFVVTDFWERRDADDEARQGIAAVMAARKAGVAHYVWSTLPDCRALSSGRYTVPHFTSKASVDAAVEDARFSAHTFVEAPMYFQNLTGPMAPQRRPDGSGVWTVPMDPERQCMHMADIVELGPLVAESFAQATLVGQGKRLSLSSGTYSWNDLSQTLNDQGHQIAVERVAGEVFDGLFPGAAELGEMMRYFEEYTYFGPDAQQKIQLANQVLGRAPTPFADWANEHMRPAPEDSR